MKTCTHGIIIGRFCAKCATTNSTPPYVYSREQVIALNPIRATQGHKPLTGKERYEMKDGKLTGRVLGENGQPL